MTKIVLAVLATAFTAVALTAPADAAKSKPGKCGTYMFYSMKMHKCMDKRK